MMNAGKIEILKPTYHATSRKLTELKDMFSKTHHFNHTVFYGCADDFVDILFLFDWF